MEHFGKMHKVYLETKDHFKSGEVFELHRDEHHALLKTVPQPDAAALDSYYDDDTYISHTDSKTGLFNKAYQGVKKYMLGKKVNLINSLQTADKKLLDIGCGTGAFLIAAKNKGWKVTGLETNALARKNLQKKDDKISVFTEIDSLMSDNQLFDVITLWHVLEHIPDYKDYLHKIHQLLKPGGYVIIAVPNFKSYDAKHYGYFWAAYDVPRHLWHFSQSALKSILAKQEFHFIKSKGLLFDAFYVSLLSEKYKGNQNYLRGFLIALYSNTKALFTKEYSSFVHIYQKRL